MTLIIYTFVALVWYSSVAVYTLWSSAYQTNIFAGQGKKERQKEKKKETEERLRVSSV